MNPATLAASFAAIRYSRIHVRLQASGGGRLGGWLGTVIHGALGPALRQICCPMPYDDCEPCLLTEVCPFPELFGKAQKIESAVQGQEELRPVALLADAGTRDGWVAGELLEIGFAVLEPARRLIPYLVEAMREMAESGLGRDRVEFEILGVWAATPDGGETPLWKPGVGLAPLAQIPTLALDTLPPISRGPLDAVTVRFLTPACLMTKGKLVDELPFVDFARAVVRRLKGLRAIAAPGTAQVEDGSEGAADWLAEARAVETVESALRPVRLVRYQAREDRLHPVPALQGHVSYRGEALRDFEPVLRLGQALLVGKKTSFGCGRYVSLPIA